MPTKKPRAEYLNAKYEPNIEAFEAFVSSVKPPEPEKKPAGILRTAGDMAIKGAQGVVDLGAGVVGLGSLVTGGAIGKGMREIGYDPEATNKALGEYLSDDQKASDEKVANASGFVDTIKSLDARSVAGGIAQSMPGMLGGMGVSSAVARGIATKAALATAEGAAASAAAIATGKTAAQAGIAALETTAGKAAATGAIESAGTRLMAAGAATEGAQTAGSLADRAQAAGREYGDYALPSVLGGAATAAVGFGSGKVFGDAATELATGAKTGLNGGTAARIAKGFAVEGGAEEMPQSATEQIASNFAMGEQDRTKGVANSAAVGLVTGGVMGAGMAGIQRRHVPTKLADTGVLSQAANAGQQALSDKINAAPPLAEALPIAPTLEAARGNNPALVNHLMRPENAETHQLDDGSPQNFNELLARNTQRNQDQQEQAQIDAEMQQARLDAVRNSGQPKPALPAPTGSFGQVNELANLADQERQDQARRVAEITQQKQQAEQQAALAGQLADTDARVAGADAQKSAATKSFILDSILSSDEARGKSPAAIARSYSKALSENNFTDSDISPIAWAKIQNRFNAEAALNDQAQEFAAPNELINAVPERKAAPVAAPSNFKSVDEAIAKGKRLITKDGNILHKKGSTPMKLSTAQREYYVNRMVHLEVFDAKAHEAATSDSNDLAQPTDAQKEAGNYKKGHVRLHGLAISIENPKGSIRAGTDPNGKEWANELQHHYGDITGTTGADGDAVDTFIGDNHASDQVFVIDQTHPDGKFDEHKAMLGFNSLEEAKAAYQANYAQDWTGGKNATETTVEGFKTWLKEGDTTKPFAPIAKEGVKKSYWEENYDRVVNSSDLSSEPIKNIVKAVNFANQVVRDEKRKGGGGGDVNKSLIDSLESELAILNGEMASRQAKDKPKAPEEAKPPVGQDLRKMTVLQMTDAQLLETLEKHPNREKSVLKQMEKRDIVDPRVKGGAAKPENATFDKKDFVDRILKPLSVEQLYQRLTVDAQMVADPENTPEELHVAQQMEAAVREELKSRGDAFAKEQKANLEKNATKKQENPAAPEPNEHASTWARMRNVDREALSLRAGNRALNAATHAKRSWDDLPKNARESIGKAIDDPSLNLAKADDVPTSAPSPKNDSVKVSSQDEMAKALDAGSTVELPNGRLVRLTHNEKHGWNFAYAYPDIPNAWAGGAMSFVPGRTVVQDKEAAIEKAIHDQARSLPKTKEEKKQEPESKQEASNAPLYGSENKVFTSEAAEKARAFLKSKLGTLNSGFDPEMAHAGLMLAGYHIEAGARTFAKFAKAMIADVGDGIRPYLRQMYESVRHTPGHDKSGMTEASSLDVAEQLGFHEGDAVEHDGVVMGVKRINANFVTFDDGRTEPLQNILPYKHEYKLVPEDRRSDAGMRSSVNRMRPDEMRSALMTSEKTGLGNERAFNEAPETPFVASIDLDSLGWINDNLGHEAGDTFLAAAGAAIKKITSDVYHTSGDEFKAHFNSEQEGHEVMARIKERLNDAIVTATTQDGTILVKKGIGLSYGIAQEFKAADAKLYADKASREQSGDRAKKGAEPTGVSRIPASGNESALPPSARKDEVTEKPQEAAQPVRPLNQIMVSVDVTNSDTGKSSKLKIPATVALSDVDKRISALENLLGCMKG